MRRAWLQILALLPLPVIGGLIVAAATHHHAPPPLALPGMNARRAAPGAPAASAALTLPPAPAPGWKLEGSPVRYDDKTLFDRIDGAAPVYLRAGFVSSLGGECRKQGSKEPITYDVYDMGSGRQALGVYATERDPSYTFVPVGDEGYLASGSLNFWRGRYYVKLAGQEQGEAIDRDLLELARGLAAALPPAPELREELALLGRLPAGRLPNGAGYSRPPLGDIDGLGDVFYADYKKGEARYRFFIVMEASPAAAAARLEKAKAYFRKDRGTAEEGSEGDARWLVARADGAATLVVQVGSTVAGGVDLPEMQARRPGGRAERRQASLLEELRPALLAALRRPAPGPSSPGKKTAEEKR